MRERHGDDRQCDAHRQCHPIVEVQSWCVRYPIEVVRAFIQPAAFGLGDGGISIHGRHHHTDGSSGASKKLGQASRSHIRAVCVAVDESLVVCALAHEEQHRPGEFVVGLQLECAVSRGTSTFEVVGLEQTERQEAVPSREVWLTLDGRASPLER